MKKYSNNIMRKLRQRLGLEPEDTSKDDIIMTWNKSEVFNEVCNWEGLIDYGNTIQDWLEDIYNIYFSEFE